MIALLFTIPESYVHVVAALETLEKGELTLERLKSQSKSIDRVSHHSVSLHIQKEPKSHRKKNKAWI